MKHGFASLSLLIFLSGSAFGQSTAPATAFEVADVHVSAPGASESGGMLPGGRFEARAQPCCISS